MRSDEFDTCDNRLTDLETLTETHTTQISTLNTWKGLIQCGTVNLGTIRAGSGNYVTISFNPVFPDTNYVCMVSHYMNGGGFAFTTATYINKYPSSCAVGVWNVMGTCGVTSYSAEAQVNWLAFHK